MNDTSSVLVTGAAGFIGSHVVRTLLERGNVKIYALDKDPLPYQISAKDLTYFRHDLGVDSPSALDEEIESLDYIVHLAALKHQQSTDEEEYIRSNINGTLDILKFAKKRDVKKVVFSSSLYAHGGMHGSALSEASVPIPTTIYGTSKLCGENLMHYADAVLGVPTVSLRYFFVYGPGQYAGRGYKSLIIGTIEKILAGKSPIINGDGLQSLDYIYVGDVVAATLTALFAPVRRTVINIGSGIAYPVNDVVAKISSIMKSTQTPLVAEPDWTDGTERWAAIGRARKLLAWEPLVSMEQGLHETISWIRNNHDGR